MNTDTSHIYTLLSGDTNVPGDTLFMQGLFNIADTAAIVDTGRLAEQKAERPSIFQTHVLHKKSTEALKRPVLDHWIMILMLIILAIYAWMMNFHGKSMLNVFSSMVHKRSSRPLSKQESVYHGLIRILLNIFILLIFSYVTYAILNYFSLFSPEETSNKWIFIKIIMFMCFYFFLKYIFVKSSAWVLKEQKSGSQYIQNIYTSGILYAILITPILLIYFFSPLLWKPIFMYSILGISILWFIFQFCRLFFVEGLFTKFSFIHNFLYFCTFEILFPLLFGKWIISVYH